MSPLPTLEIPQFEDAAQRRWWLLCKGLACVPLDRAIELARAADEFVNGRQGTGEQHRNTREAAVAPEGADDRHEDAKKLISRETRGFEAGTAPQPTRLILSPERRQQLIEALARGEKNADLARQFGLTPRQVQGMRMGSARRKATVSDPASDIQQERNRPVSLEQNRPVDGEGKRAVATEDVIRFLRQQDDVVVPEGDGSFLVNARFKMQLGELVSRANRMRLRQGKPEFLLPEAGPIAATTLQRVNGHHPMFSGDTLSSAEP